MTAKTGSLYPQVHVIGEGEGFHCPTCDDHVGPGESAWVEGVPYCCGYCAGYAPSPYLAHLEATGERSRAERFCQ